MWTSCFHRTGIKSLLMYHDARSAFIVFLCHVVTLAEHVSCMPLSVVLTDDMLIIVWQDANPEDVWEILRAVFTLCLCMWDLTRHDTLSLPTDQLCKNIMCHACSLAVVVRICMCPQ